MTRLAELAQAHARAQRVRVTDLPREAFTDLMTCTRCGALCEVFQATLGARTPEDHKWIEPGEFVCCSFEAAA